MVNPGGFTGLRRDFLEAEQEAYNAAADQGHAADVLADIQRRYFKRFPVSIPFTEEPTEEYLASVDDNAPDADLIPPSNDLLSPEDFARAQHVYELQVKELKTRKAVRSSSRHSSRYRTNLWLYLANKAQDAIRLKQD